MTATGSEGLLAETHTRLRQHVEKAGFADVWETDDANLEIVGRAAEKSLLLWCSGFFGRHSAL